MSILPPARGSLDDTSHGRSWHISAVSVIDRPTDFLVYDRACFDGSFLDSLGPIAQPRRDQAPSNVAPIPTRPRMVG